MAELPSYLPLDLARLVLGYLEEEECTAAYEEFIKSSPHLTEFRTNYNNAVMSNFSLKSLKDVFGEYCAYKAFIRNCKIPGLRTRLLQCKTLLDTAQLLITNIDFKKVPNCDDGINRSGSNITLSSNPLKEKKCDNCISTDKQLCDCGTPSPAASNSLNQVLQDAATLPALPLNNFVETTQLADLPGTIDTTKRKFENPVQLVHKPVGIQSRMEANNAVMRSSFEQIDTQTRKPPTSASTQSIDNLSVKTNNLIDCSENIHEIMNVVSRSSGGNTINTLPVAERNRSNVTNIKRKLSTTERSFQEFVSGVSAGNDGLPPTEAMPDSSTPESSSFQSNQSVQCNTHNTEPVNTTTLETGISNLNILNSRSSLPVLFADIKKADNSSAETDVSRDSVASSGYDSNRIYPDINVFSCKKPICSTSTKSVCSKVTILSNDLVKSSNGDGTITINKAGTCTTLRPLVGRPVGIKRPKPTTNSIIHINGMSVYQNNSMVASNKVFTPEEIMAMPTVFVLQPSTSTQTSSSLDIPHYTSTSSTTSSGVVQTDGGYKTFESICVEPSVQSNAGHISTKVTSLPAPKETVSLEKTSTPNKPLLAKKASSTPRRGSSSHVRVLDFNTPRQMAATKEETQENSVTSLAAVPIIVSHPSASEQVYAEVDTKMEIVVTKTKDTLKVSETCVKKPKADWDADLRALIMSSISEDESKKTKAKINKKSPKKMPKSNDLKKIKTNVEKSAKKTKIVKRKKVPVVEDLKEELPVKTNVKPTINLIKDWREPPRFPGTKSQEPVEIIIPDDTPESDVCPTTNNPITSKHNLSDFLMQTPYKTMMDNLQMETPRYIDPSVFDGPISDIKIDSIPTPNFLNTPNFLLSGGKVLPGFCATPSSYSSRPTDYSSGGSYYRPDEHEFDPLIDLKPKQQQASTLPSSSKADCSKTPKHKPQKDSVNTDSVSSRPRRQCTLKVSYCETPAVKSAKDSSKLKTSNKQSHSPSISSNSDSSQTVDSEGSVKENKINKSKDITDDKEMVLQELEKKRKRMIASLKKKTPVKNKTKRNSGGSFPKVKIEKKVKLNKKPKTVAELRQTIGPRKMPNASNERIRKKSTFRDNIALVPAAPVTTKSRRKSSTPRKVDKYIDYSVSAQISHKKQDVDITEDELPPLRVSSDDGSQDSRQSKPLVIDEAESDDIGKIKAYIETTSNKIEPTVQELVQRGFDLETAKSIERDLLGMPVTESHDNVKETGKVIVDLREQKIKNSEIIVTIERSLNQNPDVIKKTDDATSMYIFEQETSKANNVNKDISDTSLDEKNDSTIVLQDDIILVRETFDEKSNNYFTYQYDEKVVKTNAACERLDQTFGFDIQFDDINIRVSLQKLEILHDTSPKILEKTENKSVLESLKSSSSSDFEDDQRDEETLKAVESISGLPPLYTPMKVDPSTNVDSSNTDHNTSLQRQCLEIFDSTLNSLDTPVKTSFSKNCDASTPNNDDELAQESWTTSSKRKKPSCSPIQESTNKKTKSDHQILMQNIDIESLLTKLHGEDT